MPLVCFFSDQLLESDDIEFDINAQEPRDGYPDASKTSTSSILHALATGQFGGLVGRNKVDVLFSH